MHDTFKFVLAINVVRKEYIFAGLIEQISLYYYQKSKFCVTLLRVFMGHITRDNRRCELRLVFLDSHIYVRRHHEHKYKTLLYTHCVWVSTVNSFILTLVKVQLWVYVFIIYLSKLAIP